MRDTQPRLLQATRLGAVAPFRPDSPRSRADKSQRSSSQHWNQYPPRTAETRRWRPSHLHCCHRCQQQPQRCPKAAQSNVCTALQTSPARKQVAFYGVPDSSGIGGGGAAHATGPAREHRQRQRQRQRAAAAAAKPGGSLARCLSTALSLVGAVAARFGERNAKPTRPSESPTTRATWGSVMALVSTAGSESHRSGDCTVDPPPAPQPVATRCTRPGLDTTAREQEQAARPSSTRIPAPTGPAVHAHRRQHTPVRRRRCKLIKNARRREPQDSATDSADTQAQRSDLTRERACLARDAVAERPCN